MILFHDIRKQFCLLSFLDFFLNLDDFDVYKNINCCDETVKFIKNLCELILSKYFIFASYVFQVLISGRENPNAEVSPAMDAAIRNFKCVVGLNNDDPGAVAAFVSSKLLVA